MVHLIRASMRFVFYTDRRAVVAALKRIYTAPTVDAAETALLEFAETDLGAALPGVARGPGRTHGSGSSEFLAFPWPVRKIIYTTNAIESLNCQLRKIIIGCRGPLRVARTRQQQTSCDAIGFVRTRLLLCCRRFRVGSKVGLPSLDEARR